MNIVLKYLFYMTKIKGKKKKEPRNKLLILTDHGKIFFLFLYPTTGN